MPSLQRYITQTLRPEAYHGQHARPPFFEGWYFKLVDAAAENAWAVIPGIYRDRSPALDHAFVMVLDGRAQQVAYHRYPTSAFDAAEDSFHLRIGPNLFAAGFLTLNLPRLAGHLTFQGRTPWPVTWSSPGIMGWYGWFPMECYHGVVSMDHALHGRLTIEGREVDFSGGRGYIEKDWGRNFPQSWIWVQANHFGQPNVSLSASIARIPFYGRVFPGFIIGLRLDGRLYRFATYLGSELERVVVDGDRVEIDVRSGTERLQIRAEQGPTALLPAPTPGQGMIARVQESLSARVSIRLSDRRGVLRFAAESGFGGMELEGDTSILEKG